MPPAAACKPKGRRDRRHPKEEFMTGFTWMIVLLLARGDAPRGSAETCADLSAKGQYAEALEACRQAHEGAPASAEVAALLAKAEYEEGDAARSARLWNEVLERKGWNFPDAEALALALWRSGDMKGAEAAFRDALAREPSIRAHLDLADYLLSFSRWDEMRSLCDEGLNRHPRTCALEEQKAVAEASLGRDDAAAGLIRKAVVDGCPPFRWVELTPFSDRLSRPAYKALLDPKRLVEGLEGLDQKECRLRLKLLEEVPAPEVADPVVGILLKRKDYETVQRGLAILEAMGPSSMAAWKKVFSEGDFVLRKYALRNLRHLHDPAFIPLLTEELDREKIPGNQALAALALGELLLPTDRARAEALLASIPDSDSLSCAAALLLAGDAEQRRDYARSLEILNRLKQGTACRVDAKLLDRIRAKAASQAPPSPPAP
jgi:hypothetical protein